MSMINRIERLRERLEEKASHDQEVIGVLDDVAEFLDTKKNHGKTEVSGLLGLLTETGTQLQAKDDLLYEIGVELFKLEGAEVDCPLRELKEKIEEMTEVDFNGTILKVS